MKKLKISWKQFEQDIKKLAKKIPKKKYIGILVIGKGGMIPAYYLANLLGIKQLDIVNSASSNWKFEAI